MADLQAAPSPPSPDATSRPLAGRSAWLITDGVAGGIAQLRGVAQALGATESIMPVAPRWPWSMLAPWGPVSPFDRFGEADGVFSPPWPDVAIATARQTIPYIRALRRASEGKTFTVVLQDPRTGPAIADLVCAPAHDRIEGPNVLKTLTSPGPFSLERIAALRRKPAPEIEALPSPRVAVIVGGPNAVYSFPPEAKSRLAAAIRSLAELGASFLVTPSRRTPDDLRAAVADAVRPSPHIVWDRSGPNPYPAFLAHADLFVVTGDSVNMCSDACATGRPIYVFEPEGGSAKFARFHHGLRDHGATRPLPEPLAAIESWTYAPLDAAATIAREIERRMLAR